MDDRITSYIVGAALFAQPILGHIRTLIHDEVPDATETVKWGMPFFQQNGRDLAMMAAFKAHAGLGIFDGTPMATGAGMGQFGKLTTLADLPADADLRARLQAAASLAAAGKPARQPKAAARPAAEMPDDFAAALAAVPAADTAFAGFPPGAQREYVEWVTSAKQAATRASRIATATQWLAEGKKRHWKYEAC